MNQSKQNKRETYESPAVTDIAPVTVAKGQSDSLPPTTGDGGNPDEPGSGYEGDF